MAWGLQDVWVPCISSMASSSGGQHGQPMEWHGDSRMCGCHVYLPWQAHLEVSMGSPWNGMGTPGCVGAMYIFHGKLIWRSAWAAHGMAWGLQDVWVPWISSMASSSGGQHGQPMEWHGDSRMCGCHGYLPWQAHLEVSMGS